MLHHGSKLDVKMSREPVVWLQVAQQLFSCRTSQKVGFNFLAQKLFLTQQFSCVSVVVDSTRPIMAHENVYRHLDLSGVEKKHNKRKM